MRIQLGDQVFVAVPAERAAAVAYLVDRGARDVQTRDGICRPGWLAQLVDDLRTAASEPPVSAAGSASRTSEPTDGPAGGWWAGDLISVAAAEQLTGWSASYLCRLARDPVRGLGRKQAGVWQLSRTALLELVDARRSA